MLTFDDVIMYRKMASGIIPVVDAMKHKCHDLKIYHMEMLNSYFSGMLKYKRKW